ncbi:MAG: hypothetical protein M0R17_05785 [Candidatus Omnitrophica bacterium]|nr:hypothetical protein [Candidatus Omnitrophota bacterium]
MNEEIIEKLKKELQEEGEAELEDFNDEMLNWTKPQVLAYCEKALSLKDGKQEVSHSIHDVRGEQENIVNYYKGKDVNEADKLLFETAQNNFKAGYEKGRAEKEQENKKKLTIEYWENALKNGDKFWSEKYQELLSTLQEKIEELNKDLEIHEKFIRDLGLDEYSSLGDYLDLLKTCQDDVAINLLGNILDRAKIKGREEISKIFKEMGQ